MHEEDKNLKSKKEKNSEQLTEITKKTKAKGKTENSTSIKKDVAKKNLGEIKIAPEVLATIVSRIVINTRGVAGLVEHSKSGFGTLLGVKEMEEGIKVDLIDEKHMSAYISVIVEYGSVIIDVAKNIQSAVKNEIEKNTGLMVKSVDINILGIQMAKKSAKN
ncbi:MAG: Asp23/Gls24 family envelope stress response protein [Atribacterota bacterium]